MSAKADATAATASGGLRGLFEGWCLSVLPGATILHGHRNRGQPPTSGFRALPEPVPPWTSAFLLLFLLFFFFFFTTLSTRALIFDCSRPTNHRHSHLRGNTTTITITNRHTNTRIHANGRT